MASTLQILVTFVLAKDYVQLIYKTVAEPQGRVPYGIMTQKLLMENVFKFHSDIKQELEEQLSGEPF